MQIPSVDVIRQDSADLAFGQPLIENSLRGMIVETIIKHALAPHWCLCSGDWSGWDFEHVMSGTRLEVKQSAARQTWRPAKKPSPPSFDITERTGYYTGAEWHAKPGRPAQIYVFAFHPILDDTADHRDPAQWEFYVVPTEVLPSTKNISLSKVKILSGALTWNQLFEAVEQNRRRPVIGGPTMAVVQPP